MAALPVSGLRERGGFAADKGKRVDGTSASARATKKNAPYMYTASGSKDRQGARLKGRARLPETKPHTGKQTSTAQAKLASPPRRGNRRWTTLPQGQSNSQIKTSQCPPLSGPTRRMRPADLRFARCFWIVLRVTINALAIPSCVRRGLALSNDNNLSTVF